MEQDLTYVTMETRFNDLLLQKNADKRSNSKFISDERYESLIADVLAMGNTPKKKKNEFWLRTKYAVLSIKRVNFLVHPEKKNGEVLHYVKGSDLFEVLKKAHLDTGHGCRDRMLYLLSSKYANVPRSVIDLFLSLCEACVQKGSMPKKGIVVKPLVEKVMNSRCQVDLIDYSSQADGENKFVMVYQDLLTKFVILNSLPRKTSEAVAKVLFGIFTLFGAPSILHTDNGREFDNKIVTALTEMWPGVKIVHGKARHSQSQGSVERANQDIENMITTAKKDRHCVKWSQWLPFIQLTKNCAYHSGIKRSPYEAMFGHPPRTGLGNSSIPASLLEVVGTEEELRDLLDTITTPHAESDEQESDDLPADDLPADDLPTDGLPADDLPADDLPTGDLPTDDPPTDDPPTDDPPTDDPPTDDLPTDDPPTDDPPTNDDEFDMSSDTIIYPGNNTEDDSILPDIRTEMPENRAGITVGITKSGVEEAIVCLTCNKQCDPESDFECTKCDVPLHSTCAILDTDPDTLDVLLLCQLCNNQSSIDRNQSEAHQNLLKQAERMKMTSNKRMRPLEVGDTVRVPVPDVDRAKSDPRNILARVMTADENTKLYTLGTRTGLIQTSYARSQVTACKRRFIEEEEVPDGEPLPLRTISNKQSIGGKGQGFVKCGCKTKCIRGNCGCVIAERACNSRCHPRQLCRNKYNEL